MRNTKTYKFVKTVATSLAIFWVAGVILFIVAHAFTPINWTLWIHTFLMVGGGFGIGFATAKVRLVR